MEKSTLRQLHQKYIASNQGKSESNMCVIRGVVRDFEERWPHGLDFQVRNVRTSHLEEWLGFHERRLKNSSYNRYAGVLKQIYELAVKDRIIAESPFKQVTTRWKRPQKPVRLVPTVGELEAIVMNIRSQRWSPYAEATADFIEFVGLAGLGQAEAASLTWGDVDFVQNCMSIRRHKTDVHFTVPIYPHLKPLMDRLRGNVGLKATPTTQVFKIKDGNKALTAACERLGIPHFTQRNLRECLIMRLWRSGLDKKLIAKWQGHRDGGALILSTYTEVFGSDDGEYESLQLAKLAPPANIVPLDDRQAMGNTSASAA